MGTISSILLWIEITGTMNGFILMSVYLKMSQLVIEQVSKQLCTILANWISSFKSRLPAAGTSRSSWKKQKHTSHLENSLGGHFLSAYRNYSTETQFVLIETISMTSYWKHPLSTVLLVQHSVSVCWAQIFCVVVEIFAIPVLCA